MAYQEEKCRTAGAARRFRVRNILLSALAAPTLSATAPTLAGAFAARRAVMHDLSP